MNLTRQVSVLTTAWTQLSPVNGEMDLELYPNVGCWMTTVAPGDPAPTYTASGATTLIHWLSANARINFKANPSCVYVGFSSSAGNVSFTGNY